MDKKLHFCNTIINNLTTSDEITEFVRVVIDSLYGVDSNTKTQLLLSYRKLYKKRHEYKIDAVAAMMDAYVAYKHNRDAFE